MIIDIEVEIQSLEIEVDVEIGTLIGDEHKPRYEGPYEVMPSTRDDVVLETKKKRMTDDVTVFKIPYFETSNESGYTVYIASEV